MADKERVDRLLVEDAVAAELQQCDQQQKLRSGDFHDVLVEVSDKVVRCMDKEARVELDNEDHAFIERKVREMVQGCFREYEAERDQPTRYKRSERVMCNVGGERKWASGSVQAINEDDPSDSTGRTKLPYVVKIDPPNSRLISVPRDDYEVCRAEVCFGQRAGALWFTLFCLPTRQATKRRFDIGERVVCAVEGETDDVFVWAAGKITDVDYDIEKDATALLPDREWAGMRIPYRVQLDTGCKVLVHRDEQWLVRDIALQPEGPCEAGARTRCLTRLVKRQCDGVWEAVDHTTRRARPCEAPNSDDEDVCTGNRS